MSTKTSIKRVALVAVSALGFGLLSVVPAKAADVTATVTPVRIVGDTPPYAKISWTSTASLRDDGAAADTVVLALTSAPTAAAKMKIAAKASIGATTGGAIGAVGAGIDSLSGAGTAYDIVAGDVVAAGGTASLAFTVDTAGTYIGTLTTTTAGDGTANDTVSFSFTTRGAVASYTFTSDVTTTSAGGLVTATVTLADSAGNTTQPSMVDTVNLTDDTAGTWTDGALSAADLYAGTITDTYTQPGTASTATTLTATPGGTLVAAGLAAKTIAITTDTTVVSAVAMPVQGAAPAAGGNNTSFAVTVPSGVTDADGGGDTDNSDITADIPTGTSTVTVTALMAAASTTYRFKGVVSAGTLNGTGTTTAYVNATTNASSVATVTFTLAGSALSQGATLTITQVTVLNVAVAGLNAVLTQAAPSVTATSITQSPNGSMVKALGSSNSMVVTVKSNYGALLGSGYVVNLYRGATVAGTLISTATTGADSTATVTFTNAAGAVSGASEQYSVQVVPPTGAAVADNAIATVVYTTTGNITSLSVGIDGSTAALQTALGAADADITDTEATTLDKIAVVTVPSTGTVTETAAQDEIYDISDAAVVAGGTSSNTIRLAANATDDNSATYTTSTGAFVSTAAGIAWNAGVTSLEVAEGTVVYAYATKVGLHTVTVTSGGKTVAIKFWAKNVATDYYTVSATADSTSLSTGGNGLVTMTIKDMFGNVVDPANDLVTATAANKVRLAGQALTQSLSTSAAGTAQFTVIADGAPGTGTITLAPSATGAQAWAAGYDYAAKGFAAPTSSTTVTFTVSGTAVKTNDEVFAEATAAGTKADAAKTEAAAATAKAADALAEAKLATAAATKAGTDAVAAADAAKDEAALATAAATSAGTKADAAKAEAALATAAATTAGTKADAAKAEAAAATAAATKAGTDAVAAADAAKAAATKAGTDAVAAAEAATDAALEAVDGAQAAADAASLAGDAADAATVAAEEARDAADAATAAAEAATAAAEEARDAAIEGIDAANAAIDAANLAAEAADNATIAAEEARDAALAATAAIEELATQVSTLLAALRAQLTTLGNTVAKIAKKVKA